MNLFCCLCTFFATHCCLVEGKDITGTGLCDSAGELPAPALFLNSSSAQEGEWVAMRCVTSTVSFNKIFFCKNGHPFSSHKASSDAVSYTMQLQMSQETAGQYSCGYQQKDGKNQVKNSALSAPRDLIFQAGNFDLFSGNASSLVWKWVMISGAAGSAILIVTTLICLLIKRVVCHQTPSRQGADESSRAPEEAPDKNRRNTASEGQLQYAEIEFRRTVLPSSRNTEKTTYALLAPLNTKRGLNFVRTSQISNTSYEEVTECMASYGAR